MIIAYLLTVLAANLAVQYIGIVPVAPGLMAPAGVFFVGLVLILRDLVHEKHGLKGSLLAIAAGSVLSLLLADPALVIASVAAFLLAELLDLAVYVPVRERFGLAAAAGFSGIVGSAADSYVFLTLAFGDLTFFWGQLVGKLVMTAVAVMVLTMHRRQLARSAE